MPTLSLTTSISELSHVRRLPGTWTPSDYRRLFEGLGVDDDPSYTDSDLEEMALLSLQDLEPEEAMQAVLKTFAGDLFRAGQIQSLQEELKEDRAWEEYSTITHQRALYVCGDLLNAAFPSVYPEPIACRWRFSISGPGVVAAHAAHPADAATLLRAIATTQADSCILCRFFEDQLAGADFPEAVSVVWHSEIEATAPDELTATLWGSDYWFRGFDDEATATADLDWPA